MYVIWKICGIEETDTLIESIIDKGIERVEGVGEEETVVCK